MPRVRPTPIILAAAAAACALVPGCFRSRPPAGPEPRLDCPPPMLWQAGKPRPRLLRVVNLSADSVVIFTDDCMAGTRVGDVGAERTRLFALPERLIAFDGGLRFHTVRGAGTKNPDVVVTTIPIDTARELRLEVPKEAPAPCPIEMYLDGKRVLGDTLPASRDEVIGIEYFIPPDRPPGGQVECPAVNVRTRR